MREDGGSTRSKCFLIQWRPARPSLIAPPSNASPSPASNREQKAGLYLWAEYNPSHRYALGADTGKGNRNDHSTSVLIDFSTIPARQVGSYANNHIPADQFAYELKRQADLFGSCLIAPEKNSESGGSCLTTLKMIYKADDIYRQAPLDRISDQPLGSGELGWRPTAPPSTSSSTTCERP